MNENTIICKRCGNCCIDVGRTFWKNGNYEDVDEELNNWAHNGDHEDGNKACEMLAWDDNGKSICFIHMLYGYDAKPDVCKEHQGDERCQR